MPKVPPQYAILLGHFDAAEKSGLVELWRSTDDVPHATITKRDGHRENVPIQSRPFKGWLRALVPDKPMGKHTVGEVLDIIEGRAAENAPVFKTFVRIAGSPDRKTIYLDLGREDWKVVKIDASGWDVLKEEEPVPVKFVRPDGTLPLPIPKKGGRVEGLKPFVHTKDDGFILFVGAAFSLFMPEGPYPINIFQGAADSAKTTCMEVLRRVCDPRKASKRTLPGGDRDLAISAENTWIMSYDNISSLTQKQSDAICRLATGGGFGTRSLYTNRGEVLIDVCRPVILNSIGQLSTAAGSNTDMHSRAITHHLARIKKEHRISERYLWPQFEAKWPKILGAFLSAAVVALRNLPEIKARGMPRMADFLMWVAAAEVEAFGWERGTFLRIFNTAQSQSYVDALEAWPILGPLQKLLGRKLNQTMTATPTELLDELEAVLGGGKPRDWPGAPHRLTAQINQHEVGLSAIGIHVRTWRKTDRIRTRMIELVAKADAVRTLPGRYKLASPSIQDAADAADAPFSLIRGKRDIAALSMKKTSVRTVRSVPSSVCGASADGEGRPPPSSKPKRGRIVAPEEEKRRRRKAMAEEDVAMHKVRHARAQKQNSVRKAM